MTTLASRILEISALPLSYKTRKFFYGVASEKEAMSILKKKVVPVQKSSRKKGAPVEGMSYLSVNLKRASEFANCSFGTKWTKARMSSAGRYGYIFVVTSDNLTDIFPNETEVGRFVQRTYDMQYGERGNNQEITPQAMSFLTHVWGVLGRKEQKAVIYDEVKAASEIGKTVLDNLPPSYLLWMLQHDVNLTNKGAVEFSSCYRIDRGRLTDIDTEGTNFYDIAEKVA